MTVRMLDYTIADPVELNHAYITFINAGGLFVPTKETFSFGEKVQVNLKLPHREDKIIIDGKVVWITPFNAIHHELPGIGIEFIGERAKVVNNEIVVNLVPAREVGGYTCGMAEITRSY